MIKRTSSYQRVRASRIAAVQGIYQMTYSGQTSSSFIEEFTFYRFRTGDYPYKLHEPTFRSLVFSSNKHSWTIQTIMVSTLINGWTLERVDSVFRSILTVAIAELLDNPTIKPAPVLISEYVDLSRSFFNEEKAFYVNRVLDCIARFLVLQLEKNKK